MPEKNADSAVPAGFTLKETLQGNLQDIYQLVWSPHGRFLALVSSDNSIEVWDTNTWKLRNVLHKAFLNYTSIAWSPDEQKLALAGKGNIIIWEVETNKIRQWSGVETEILFCCIAWSPNGKILASGADDKAVRTWNVETGQIYALHIGHSSKVRSLSWSPKGHMLVSGDDEGKILLWDTKKERSSFSCFGHTDVVSCLIWSIDGDVFASGSFDRTVRLWDKTGQQKGILEGHTASITSVSFIAVPSENYLLVSKSRDGSVGVWQPYLQELRAVFKEPFSHNYYSSLAFHPHQPVMATVGDGNASVCIWNIDLQYLFRITSNTSSVLYRNAKVVILGNSGTGKTSLNRALTGLPFDSALSAQEHHVSVLDRREVIQGDARREIREIFLWDLDGRSGYRLIHQLYLYEVTVALIILDTRSETDPFDSVREWDRALRLVQRIKGNTVLPMKKFLVVARVDRGKGGVNQKNIRALMKDLEFDGYYETSAKEGQGIAELAEAIRAAIEWEQLPRVISTELFQKIRAFLLDKKKVGQCLCTEGELYEAFLGLQSEQQIPLGEEQYAQFETCIGRLESQGMIRRLNFGNYILLQPELLDDHAASLLDVMRDEPDGLGSIAENRVQRGDFFIPAKVRLKDKGHESILLSSMINDFILHEIALREHADDSLRSTYLVFPSQSTVENPSLPDAEEKFAVFHFVGEVTHVYAPLAVRLSHSGIFAKSDLWKNAITYTSRRDEECGIFLRAHDRMHGELTVFFDKATSMETRLQFASYVYWFLESHTQLITVQPILVCPQCGSRFPNEHVRSRQEMQKATITCSGCDTKVKLPDSQGHNIFTYSSAVQQMDRDADLRRKHETNASVIQRKKESDTYDVFFCFNDNEVDAVEVERICRRLEEEGYLPWLEAIDLQPGLLRLPQIEQHIQKIKIAAVFVGKDEGSTPWQQNEMYAILEQAMKDNYTVIPVLLKHVSKQPSLPPFLRAMVWVDFRTWNPDPIQQLIRGITGKRRRL